MTSHLLTRSCSPGADSRQSLNGGTKEKPRGKGQVIAQVAASKAGGFLPQPVQPLKPDTLHPSRSPANASAKKAETDPDAKPPDSWELVAQLRDQLLLLRRAQRHVNDVRVGLRDLYLDPTAFIRVSLESKRWAIGPGNDKIRVTLQKYLCGCVGGARIAAQ